MRIKITVFVLQGRDRFCRRDARVADEPGDPKSVGSARCDFRVRAGRRVAHGGVATISGVLVGVLIMGPCRMR